LALTTKINPWRERSGVFSSKGVFLMHNINSFSELLAQGQITEALQLRLEAIEASARHYRQDLEAAKVSVSALGVVGLLLSANPLVAVIAGCGLASYGYTVLRDYQNTKRLCLLPLVRKGQGNY
jgi:divalent metal cation (Fe/Co/Zn/Cd) transporter